MDQQEDGRGLMVRLGHGAAAAAVTVGIMQLLFYLAGIAPLRPGIAVIIIAAVSFGYAFRSGFQR